MEFWGTRSLEQNHGTSAETRRLHLGDPLTRPFGTTASITGADVHITTTQPIEEDLYYHLIGGDSLEFIQARIPSTEVHTIHVLKVKNANRYTFLIRDSELGPAR